MQTTTVRAIIPSWDGEDYNTTSSPSAFSVALIGATESVNGGTHIKKNSAPTHSEDYDVRCDSHGLLRGEVPLADVTKVYIWGYGYTLNGLHYECEPIYSDATEIEITEDTEIVLWGANSE